MMCRGNNRYFSVPHTVNILYQLCVFVCVQLPQAQQGQTGPASSQPNLLHMPHRQSPLHQASSSSSTSSSSSALSVGQLVSSKCLTQLTKTQHAYKYSTLCILLLRLYSVNMTKGWVYPTYPKKYILTFHLCLADFNCWGWWQYWRSNFSRIVKGTLNDPRRKNLLLIKISVCHWNPYSRLLLFS